MNKELREKRVLQGEMALNACNAGALINTIANWMDEDKELRFDELTNDPGTFLVMNQLAQLFNTNDHAKFKECYLLAQDVREAQELQKMQLSRNGK